MLTYLIFRLGWLPFGLIVALLVLFIVHSFRQCWRQKSVLGQLVSYSVLLTFALQTFHYITYNTGILLFAPLSLPLISYGLGGMVVNMGLLGLMLSVFRNGSAARDRAQPSSARQPFITWRERKLVIDFGRKHGE
jgi:cell division protein FtsW (lipid II flippase)